MTVKKTLTAALAALTLTSASLAPTSQAQAGSLGKAVAIGILGTAVGVIAGAASARARQDDGYRAGYRSQEGGYRPAYRPVRSYEGGYGGGYGGGCGFRNSPIFDEYGNRIGARRVPAC